MKLSKTSFIVLGAGVLTTGSLLFAGPASAQAHGGNNAAAGASQGTSIGAFKGGLF